MIRACRVPKDKSDDSIVAPATLTLKARKKSEKFGRLNFMSKIFVKKSCINNLKPIYSSLILILPKKEKFLKKKEKIHQLNKNGLSVRQKLRVKKKV